MIIGNALLNVIQSLVNICQKYNISFVLMGGIATSFYTRPRATYDVDAIVSLEKENLSKFFTAISKKGYIYDKKHPVKHIHNLPFLSLFYKRDKLYVDIFIAENEFQKGIINRARKIKFENTKVNIISPEDLVLLKLLTGRERDTEDVRNIICENLKTLDFKYIRRWAKCLGIKVFLDDEIKSLRIKT